MEQKWIAGGFCAAAGFFASGTHCGVRKNTQKPDLALFYSDTPCTAAAVFTRNLVKAAPVLLDMEKIRSGRGRAILANSGNANACAPGDRENALRMAKATAAALQLAEEEVYVSSTGVIGQPLNIAAIEAGLPAAIAALSPDAEGSDQAAQAIMTTDTRKKEVACAFSVGGKTAHLGGVAKGSGMIHPNMGTMLCYLSTDCAVTQPLLQQALTDAVARSFNRVSVDGDTSTNDSCFLFANGQAGNAEIIEQGADYQSFFAALSAVCIELARGIAGDGEGASHLITCSVSGAATEADAEALAKAVICSPLTKAAVFGRDANWGRVLCAMGYAGIAFDPGQAEIAFASTAGRIVVCQGGKGLAFDEDLAKTVLSEYEVRIEATLAAGSASATCWGCDLTYDYVRINGDYRT